MRLSEDEDIIAVDAGRARQKRRIEAGVPRDSRSYCTDVAGGHIYGVRGEIVLAKVLGIDWIETVYKKGEPDLEGGIEARLRTMHWYDLFIHDDDNDERLFFLITKEKGDPDYYVHGCISGREGKRLGVWKQITTNPPDFFVDKKHLVPIEDVLTLLK